jgi:hypothetical protein
MHVRLLGMALVVGCFVVAPSTSFADGSGARHGGGRASGDRSGGRGSGRADGQARATAPRGTRVVSRGTAKPTTAERAAGARSRGSRPLVAIAVPYVEADSNERGSSEPDAAPPPPTARPYTSSESSSIRPLPPSEPPQPARPSARGNLRLEIEPRTAQVYVDGFYVGTVEDLNRSAPGLNLAAGWHRLEFRAPGYETPAVNVTIEANRTASYRGELKPTRP